MTIHVCELCGYEYNPIAGDPENGIDEKTEFEDLPADWTCPLCGATKDDFETFVTDEDQDEEEI